MTAANPGPLPVPERAARGSAVDSPRQVSRPWQELLGRGAVVVATAFVAVTAFVLAYDGSRGAAVDAGITAAGWYPFCIEGVIVCSSVATMALAGRAYPWVILLLFTAVSVAANVLHAWQHPGTHWWSLVFAAVPPLALPICVHLVLIVLKAAHLAEPAEPSQTAPVPQLAEPAAVPQPGLKVVREFYEPVVPERPDGAEAAVYRLYGEPGTLLYVGCSAEPGNRMKEHRRSAWWSQVRHSRVVWYGSKDEAADAEQQVILTENPAHNVGYTRYAHASPRPDGGVGQVDPMDHGRASARRREGWGSGPRYQCECGSAACPGVVSKATRSRHMTKVRESAGLADPPA